MKMFKALFTALLAFGLLNSYTQIASAEMLFSVGAGVGQTDYSSSYSGSTYEQLNLLGTNEKGDTMAASLKANLLLIKVYLDASSTKFSQSDMYRIALSTGWELGPSILRAHAFAGGKGYIIEDRSGQADIRNVFYAVGGGLGVSSKLANLQVYGNVFVPVFTRYKSEVEEDNGAKMSYMEAGVSMATIPFVDIYANYRKESGDSNVMDFNATTYTAGVKVSF